MFKRCLFYFTDLVRTSTCTVAQTAGTSSQCRSCQWLMILTSQRHLRSCKLTPASLWLSHVTPWCFRTDSSTPRGSSVPTSGEFALNISPDSARVEPHFEHVSLLMWICVFFFAIRGSEEVTLWHSSDAICERKLSFCCANQFLTAGYLILIFCWIKYFRMASLFRRLLLTNTLMQRSLNRASSTMSVVSPKHKNKHLVNERSVVLQQRCFASAKPVAQKKTVTLHFKKKDDKTTVQAKVGDNLLDVIIDNDVDVDGFGALWGYAGVLHLSSHFHGGKLRKDQREADRRGTGHVGPCLRIRRHFPPGLSGYRDRRNERMGDSGTWRRKWCQGTLM